MSYPTSRVVYLGTNRELKFIYEEKLNPLPSVKDGEVLGKVRLASICEYIKELNSEEGGVAQTSTIEPHIPGHEAVVEIIESRQLSLKQGQRVIFSVLDTCQTCTACKEGTGQYCVNKKKYGLQPLSGPDGAFKGCFSSHILLGPGTKVIPVPENVPDQEAVTTSTALSVAVAAVALTPDQRDIPILVQGSDLVGIYACMILHHRGYTRVFCFDQDRSRVMRAAPFGAIIIHPDLPQFSDVPKERQVAMVIDTTCTQESLKSSLFFLQPGGVYVLVGVRSKIRKVSIPHKFIIERGLLVKGISDPSPDDLVKAVEFLKATSSLYPYNSLYTGSPEILMKEFHVAMQHAASGEHFRVFVKP